MAPEGAGMTDPSAAPPRWACALLRACVRRSDVESIPGDLLEEYGEGKRPSLGRVQADLWYLAQVFSVMWRVAWPGALAMIALRVVSFPLPGNWNPSVVPAPGVSVLDAAILLCAGYYGARRTGRFVTGVVAAGVTALGGFTVFAVTAVLTSPGLLRVPLEKPFTLVIACLILALAVTFGLVVGAVGALLGRRGSSRPRPRGSAHDGGPDPTRRQRPGAERRRGCVYDIVGVTVALVADDMRRSVAQPAFYMWLFGALVVVAIVLAVTSVLGMTWQAVGVRTREIGVRLALGARPDQVVSLFLWTEGLPVVSPSSGIGDHLRRPALSANSRRLPRTVRAANSAACLEHVAQGRTVLPHSVDYWNSSYLRGNSGVCR